MPPADPGKMVSVRIVQHKPLPDELLELARS
jgi:hypothetical protein